MIGHDGVGVVIAESVGMTEYLNAITTQRIPQDHAFTATPRKTNNIIIIIPMTMFIVLSS